MPINFDDLSEENLREIRQIPKKRSKTLPDKRQRGSVCRDYELAAGEHRFALFARQNQNDQSDFSVGIRVTNLQGSRKSLMLSRYNGSGHVHREFNRQNHVHYTTAESQHCRKPENGRVVRGDYVNMNEALAQLIKEYNVSGIPIQEELL